MDEPASRHEFLRSVGRGGLLLGLTGLGVAALMGSKSPSECINTGICGSCNAYKVCALPEKKETTDERKKETRPA